MNSAEVVDRRIESWKKKGYGKAEMVPLIAASCLGWSYVFGARGSYCTPSYRESRARSSGEEGPVIIKNCQVLNGKKASCEGCKWYPGGQKTRCFDCRGFTYWVLKQVGVTIEGAGATSQWNTAKNWKVKGDIKDMPADQVCCVFWKDKKKPGVMGHTGLYLGNGKIIHCSGEVKEGKPTDKGWTNYAIPAGLDGTSPSWRPTIRKGSKGEDVKYCQELLNKLGNSLTVDGKFGSKTLAAVKAFQKANGITADGIVGPCTWEALEAAAQDDKLYTVIIQHLRKNQAEAIVAAYGGEMKEEANETEPAGTD